MFLEYSKLSNSLNLNSKSHTSASNEESGSHHDHHHSSDEHNGSFDPHIWLNPELTKQIAEVIYQQLTIQYPALKSQFKQNLDDFVSQLSIAEQKIANQFGAQKPLSIYTFHQAFTHFAEHYGLHIEGTITRTPEARPGAKHLSELSKEIQQKSKICLVKEPNFKAPYINSIASETEVVFTTADPLATTIENSPKGYIDFIHSIADSFYQCFE